MLTAGPSFMPPYGGVPQGTYGYGGAAAPAFNTFNPY